MTLMQRQGLAPAALAAVLACFAGIATAEEGASPSGISFNRDIRVVLSDNCFKCHGPDPTTREADLRLDTREGATAERDGSLPAITPGKPDMSEVLARLTTDDADLRMPPADSGKQLTPEQVEKIRQWIAAGAPYETHWAFRPVEHPQPPQVKQADWPKNDIDRFVLARLEQEGLTPSGEADRYTLIRRVYLDLLGLPPTPEEVDKFVQDKRPNAYELLLDAVLSSERFGERWGRYWLDQARYADSHGYTNDNERVIWPYRDWVIKAFNRDLPFDQFTIEQLAGDLLPEPTRDQLVATGFHRNTLINSEGGTKADQFRDEQVKDRVDTTGGVWLGLTIGCAKCHTHKYDPISQHEYYSFYAFFNSTADNNSITPTIKAPTEEQETRLAELDARHAELEQQLSGDADKAARQKVWEQTILQQAKAAAGESASEEGTKWEVVDVDAKSENGATFNRLEDKSVVAVGTNKASDSYRLTVRPELRTIRSVRLEALKHDTLPAGGPGRAGNGNFVLSEFWFRTGDGRELRFSKAQADHSQKGYDVNGAIDNKADTGWAVNGSAEGGANHDRVAWFVLPAPLELGDDEALTFTLQFDNGGSSYNLGRLRLSLADTEWVDRPSTDTLAKIVEVPAEKRSKPQVQRLEEAFLRADPKLGPVYSELQHVAKERETLSGQIATTMVMRELDKPRPAHVQVRGDFLRTADPVDPNVPTVLPPLKDTITETASGRNRLDLARWLVDTSNPLTPRVRVNRIWMRLFGTGLVETENDFGTQGTQPTHPELLDWLASEFVRDGWSTKRLLHTIAMSATYRQSSHVRPELAKVDPRNLLLARQSRIRVEAEIVRDLGLAVSGLLSDKIGGPGVFPPQPDGVYAFTQRAKNWKTSTGEDRYRRGMYTFFYRSAPYPMLSTFDAPKFNQTCTRRDRSNTPLQSLTVANDAAMFEMMQALAARVLKEVPATEDQSAQDTANARLTRLFRLCLARTPEKAEQEYLLGFLKSQEAHYAAQEDDAKQVAMTAWPEDISVSEAAAWVATARVLVNLDEFITRE